MVNKIDSAEGGTRRPEIKPVKKPAETQNDPNKEKSPEERVEQAEDSIELSDRARAQLKRLQQEEKKNE